MKSPTSLITIRNAVGVMLAMSAIFAVVLTAISIPSDNAQAQVADADDVVAERAEAWFNSLTLDEAINALLGKEADAVADDTTDPIDETTLDRQYVDTDDPAAINRDIEYIYDAWTKKSDTQSFYGGLPAAAGGTGNTNANQAQVRNLVDGNTNTVADIYAVGEQNVTGSTAIRGFQSVELWWDHLTCAEARIAVGEDNNDLLTTDQDTDTLGFQAEDSAVCDDTLNTAGDAVLSTSVKAYSDVKAMADAAGLAILGLETAESTLAARGRDAQWWALLSADQRAQALYGVNAGTAPADPGTGTEITVTREQLASLPFDEISTTKTYTFDRAGADVTLALDSASQALAREVKALITDRWRWIYDDGGRNEMGISRVVFWWDNIGCTEWMIAAGQNNEAETTNVFCNDWEGLQTDPVTAAGQVRQARVFELGYAIVFPNNDDNPVPDVEAWWNTLNADQMVYVVYGNPPMRTAYDDPDDDPDAGATVTTVTDADKAVFQKMYDGLADDDGIRVATGTDLSAHLPTYVTAMLGRNGMEVNTPTEGPDGDDANTDPDYFYYSAKAIVNAIANELFDPPTQEMRWVRPDGTLRATSSADDATPVDVPDDDQDFDWPYTPVSDTDDLPDNLAATVADWWERTDCRVMRIAVGEDNNYLNGAIADDAGTTDVDESMDAETSMFCAHFPGHDDNDANDLGEVAQKRAVIVGAALLGLTAEANGFHAGRPSFNEAATGIPTIGGVAQVGSTLTSSEGNVDDTDGKGDYSYQWLRDDDPIPGATNSSYTLGPDDNGKTIKVRYSFTDGGRYYEMRTSNATSTIAGSPGEISRIEPSIRGVTVSSGDTVQLSVEIYGLQNSKDNSIGGTFTWTQNGDDIDGAGNGREITYTAPSSPGTYTVKAELGGGSCQPADEDDRDAACSAEITVQVRRPSAPVEPDPEPVNPPGDIPTILTDSDGNQYEVFTPVDGGTFDSGEGYRIHVPSGAVPNGEFIGIRMADGGAASNIGMTHQRYTLGGNMYGIHAVDASGAAVSSYELDDPATVCLPLPAALRSSIADLAVVSINSNGSLTVHSASVRIGEAGTQVCGNVSGIPTSVAVGSQGAPDAIPTPVVEVPVLPETGATAPSSNGALFALILGIATLSLGTFVAVARRRNRSTSR